MLGVLITISLILHIVVLAAVYHIYNQIQLVKRSHTAEIMEVFETYLEEIKTENRILQDQLKDNSPLPIKKVQKTDTKTAEFPPPPINNEYTQTKNINENIYMKATNNNGDDAFKASLESKVLQLHNQGLTEEEIARQLNCGKTEVVLIINLYGQKNHKS